MWFKSRPLQTLSYGRRVAAPPTPAAWLTVYAKRVVGFPTYDQSLWFAGFYVVVCVWYGSLRELAARRISATHRHPNPFNWWRDGLLRCLDTLSNAATACCFLYFLVFEEPSYFPVVFFVSVSTHVVIELEVAHRLRCVHSDHAYLGGRRPTTHELEALNELNNIEEVSVAGVSLQNKENK